MNDEQLRAWWWHRQGLDGTLRKASASEVLAQSGWARSVGGVGPYLTLHARAGIGRAATDAAVARLEIHELPSARGCTYVVPVSDFALALAVGQGFGHEQEMKVARKLGVTDAEIDRLSAAVVGALGTNALGTDELREAAGGAARSLGPEGKKKGLTTTLPLALGKLQAEGEIRRVPTDGRLDQQRYRYAAWRPNPLAKFRLSQEEAYAELARRFFRWIGPATVAQFQGFSGLGVKAAKAAVEPLGLAPLDPGDERLIFPEDRDALLSFVPPKKAGYALVSGLDALFLLRRDLASLVADSDKKRDVFVDKDVKPLGGLADLPSHAIVDRGRIVGLWEYDVDTESIAWMAFVPRDAALEQAVAATESYVRTDLQDARSFSLDSPKSRTPRVEAVRQAGRLAR
ncbi:MAG TPA: crosslink repair DNA glycosylase YcaQ family protein [Thermoanaerobaculia bacterium]|nr:crosslink repair DNA glycosylase YcaQ family protein [Thermoanaerobaculia bacterium]